MKISILVLFFFAGMVRIYSQEVYGIRLDSLAAAAKTDSSWFKDIDSRIIQGDTTLTFREYTLAYYGSAYFGDYQPYGESINLKIIDTLLKKMEYDSALDIAFQIAGNSPAFCRVYEYIGYTWIQKRDTVKAKQYYNTFYNLLQVPYFSGTGLSTDSAMWVRSVDDEYLLLREMGYQVNSQALIFEGNIPYDEMSVVFREREAEGKEETIYFNVYLPFSLGLKTSFDQDDNVKTKKTKKGNKTKGKR